MGYRKIVGLFVVVLGYMFIGAASVSAQVTTSTRPVYTFQDDAGNLLDSQTEVPFSDSELVRTNQDSVCISVNTNSLPPGAYSNWWVIFNNWENCENPLPVGGARCSEPDLFNPDVNPTALWATGGIVGPDGEAHFSACLNAGEAPGLVIFGDGLQDVQGAEIHYILKNHGPVSSAAPLLLGQQLTTLSGTEPPCNPTKELPFQCPDPQVVIHSPFEPENSDGDGIPDDEDDCPNSDLGDTVIIDSCDSGVENTFFDNGSAFGDGCTISDLIAGLAADAANHGEFVSGVAQLTNDLKATGIITGKENGRIQSCSAQAAIP